MIFVTVGSQKFQFNRLLLKVDELIADGIMTDSVFAQIGESTYIPMNYAYQRFIEKTEFDDYLNKADVVITHGGTGVIMSAVKRGKKVIAVPRLAKYAEHVDDHQLQLLSQFDDLAIIEYAKNIDDLGRHFVVSLQKSFKEYCSNSDKIINDIDEFVVGVIRGTRENIIRK